MVENIVGILGGTGLGEALSEQLSGAESVKPRTPFGKPSGEVLLGNIGSNRVAFLNRHGSGHKLSPSEIPYRANIFALKELGVRTVISSGAVGSLNEQIVPGDLVLVDQFIDKSYKREGSFFEGFGAVHCEMSEPTCSRVRGILGNKAEQIGVLTHSKGTYVCMEGPQFSTRAESLMHRFWGADLIGMTAMPEAKLAREAQMCYALVALVSDYDCWRPRKEGEDKQSLLEEIISNMEKATENCLRLIKNVLTNEKGLVFSECQCRKSLDLAVWTDQNQIDTADKEKLKILFE